MPEFKTFIYADTNVYGRPFDDLSVFQVAIEAESARLFFEFVYHSEHVVLISSDILKLEIQRTKDLRKKGWMTALLSLCQENIDETEAVADLAQKIAQIVRLKPRDAIHLASAIGGNAKFFISADDDFLNKAELIRQEYKIKVISLMDFIKQL